MAMRTPSVPSVRRPTASTARLRRPGRTKPALERCSKSCRFRSAICCRVLMPKKYSRAKSKRLLPIASYSQYARSTVRWSLWHVEKARLASSAASRADGGAMKGLRDDRDAAMRAPRQRRRTYPERMSLPTRQSTGSVER